MAQRRDFEGRIVEEPVTIARPMHSVLATIILGWGAVYGYAAFYGIALFRRRPERREYLTFGLMAVALMVQCAGGVLLTDARDTTTADVAVRVKIIGSVWTLAFIHHFAVQLAGARWERLVKLAYAYAGLNSLVAIVGLATVAGEEAPPPAWGLSSAPDYLEPRLSAVGSIAGIFGWVIVASTLVALFQAKRQDPRVRLVLWAFVANVVVVIHDTLIQVASLRSIYLAEHTALLTMAAVSAILLDRYTRTSEELDVRTRQLSTSVGELRHTEAELVKKEQLAAVGALSGLIANQVEQPLERISRTTTGLRAKTISDESRTKLLTSLEEEVDRLNRLVDDLLAYARPVKLQARPVGIRELITETLGAKVPPDASIETEVEIDDSQPMVYGDGDLLRTALSHIIHNALSAMPDGGRLHVVARPRTESEETSIVLSITDSGEGMDEDTLRRARDPFFTTHARGTGMGLAIVERIVKLHDGTMDLESSPGRGTTVHITIPIGVPTSSSGDDHDRHRSEP
jgi:signal transduction histidine kinase